jgi:hypothetical protein
MAAIAAKASRQSTSSATRRMSSSWHGFRGEVDAALPLRGHRSRSGTASAVGATTSPGWGWGSNPYYAGGPYAGHPYYGGGSWGANAYYALPAASTANAPAWNLYTAYRDNGPFYGYSGWSDYETRGGIGCDPGTVYKTENGVHYIC